MRPPSEEVVDGQVLGYGDYADVSQVRPPPGVTVLGAQPAAGTSGVAGGGSVPLPFDLQSGFSYVEAFAADQQRARSVTLFVEVPVLAYVALHPGVGGLVRLAAAALGVYRVAQVMGPPQEPVY
jgi:hypothetical protein